MRISDWSSDVCSSDLDQAAVAGATAVLGDRLGDDLRGGLGGGVHHLGAGILVLASTGVGHGEHLAGGLRPDHVDRGVLHREARSEEHTSELQSLMRISYAVFCLKKKNTQKIHHL